ncbi:MAG: hypothetical protein SH820_08000 [Xanthomonadales bacterium]|nr:hypothetical protein [Xanthomonadales bacterium]
MRTRKYLALWLGLVSVCNLYAADPSASEVQALRDELKVIRTEYESRIDELERRLDAAEQATRDASNTANLAQEEVRQARAEIAVPAASSSSASSVSVAPDNSFNPSMGVIFQGQAWAYEQNPEDYAIAGFPFGGEAGPAAEGFSLAETEINIAANVDDKFTAWLTMPIVYEDGETKVEIEEAWVETLALPAGLSVRMGRTYSNIGYVNNQHSHSWDFTDQPLPYQAFLGNQYLDDGLQMRWLAPTDFYLEVGAELFRGDRYPSGGATNSGFGSHTLSLRSGGDVGVSNSWLAGLSWLSADSADRPSGDANDPLLFNGATDLYIASFVWKWSPFGNWREGNFKFQAEYLWRNEKGAYSVLGLDSMPWDSDQHGWYMQAIYQPLAQWRFGVRMDRLGGDVPSSAWAGTPLYYPGDDPSRYSLMVDWSNSEFSRLRFQYTLDDSSGENDNQFGLQYIYSIGAHGAHSF